jgi:hypothetical protein
MSIDKFLGSIPLFGVIGGLTYITISGVQNGKFCYIIKNKYKHNINNS